MGRGSKEVKKQQRSKDFYFIVYQLIKKGYSPSVISKELGITKQSLNYYLSSLKAHGFIKKIGYGVWSICKEYDRKEVKKRVVIGTNSRHTLKPDMVRGHAFMLRIRLPKIKGWEDRAQKLKFPFETYYVGGVARGQRFKFKGFDIALTDKSLIIHTKQSFLGDTAQEVRERVIYDILALVRSLERAIGAVFSMNGKYFFRVSRQHYALIKNALAKQYDQEGKKLECYTHRGLWLVIDNSYNLHEVETLHPETADKDNENVQNFFNSLKGMDGYTPSFVVNSLAENARNLGHYARHLEAHVESIQELGKSIKELTRVVRRLKEDGRRKS